MIDKMKLTYQEMEDLHHKGLQLRLYYEEKLDNTLYYITGKHIDSDNIKYYNTPREAYEAFVSPQLSSWPSSEYMDRYKFFTKIFNDVSNARKKPS